jgi:hypothetical protein
MNYISSSLDPSVMLIKHILKLNLHSIMCLSEQFQYIKIYIYNLVPTNLSGHFPSLPSGLWLSPRGQGVVPGKGLPLVCLGLSDVAK